MARKDKKIVEKEPVVVDEKAIITDEVPAEDTIEVAASKKLICKQSFTDKFNAEIVYKIGDELNITDIARRKDLIERGLAVEE